MLDQLINIVKQMGQKSVVHNPEVPNEHNQEVMAEATNTIASGFKNVMAGGGLQSIVDLFRGGGNTSGNNKSGIGGLLKNPIVMMMVGHFISKLVSKYRMKPAAASSVANNLIPNSVEGLIEQTNDPKNLNVDMDGFLTSVAGGEKDEEDRRIENSSEDGPLQKLLGKVTGGDINGDGKINMQDLIARFTRKSQNSYHEEQAGGGGLFDLIKGFMK